MAKLRHDIAEHDVVVLRSQVGDWPAGTVGTAVRIYARSALVEVSGEPAAEALDRLMSCRRISSK